MRVISWISEKFLNLRYFSFRRLQHNLESNFGLWREFWLLKSVSGFKKILWKKQLFAFLSYRNNHRSDLHETEVWWSWEILFSNFRNFESEKSKFLGNFDTWSWQPYYVTEPIKILAPPVARFMILCGSDKESYFTSAINRVCRNIAWCLL